MCVDQGIRNALLREYEVRDENVGFVVENIVGMHLYTAARRAGMTLFYVRNNGEVDFAIKGKSMVLVEVKYRNKIDPGEIRKLQDSMQAAECNRAYIVTKDDRRTLKSGKATIQMIPALLFCLSIADTIAMGDPMDTD